MTYTRSPFARWGRLGVGLALALSAAACSSDDGGGTVEPTPTIGVSVATPTVTVVAGQSGTAAVTVTRGGGYTGAVNLTVEGTIPAGSATPNPAALASGVTASTINITTGSATPAGTYTLTVRAAGTGAVAAVTTPLTVTVTAPTPAQGFTIAPAAALTVTQGAAAQNATINITRTGGFAGAVTLTTGTIPAGLTVTPAAASTGNSITVAVAATTIAPGTYPITINATGAGITGTQTTTLNVTVAAPQATPDFSIAASAVSVQAGATTPGTSTVTITRTGGFTGAVTVTATSANGLTITPPAATTGNTATLSITAPSTLAPGTYPVAVSATGTGVTGTKTATFDVTVTPAVQVGGYTLGTTGAVTVQQGATATTTLNVTRTGGFAGGVTITPTGAPNGVQVTVTPNPVTGNTATVSVAATGAATTGNATITLTGAATGLANQTTTLSVNVTAASTGGGNVSYAFCAPDIPIWFAYQNDAGNWTRVTAGANNTFAFNVPTRGGIAYVTQTGTNYDLTVVYGTAAELIAGGQQRCTTLPRGTKRLTGSVAGVAATDFASVSLGGSSEILVGGQTTFTLDSVPEGSLNLLASRSAIDLATFSLTPNRLILRRGVNYANNAVIPTLDFNGSESFAPATANLTINGAGTDTAFVATTFFTGAFNLSGFGTGGVFFNFGSSPLRYAGVPTERLQAGDMHALVAFANVRGDSTSSRGIYSFVRTITDRSVTIGPAPSAATVTAITSTPYLRLRATAASQASYNAGASVSFTQATRTANISVTPGYVGSAPATWDLSVPDLTAAGFDASWGLRPATRTDWAFSTYGGNFLAFIGGVPAEGTTFNFASKTGSFAGALRSFSRQPSAAGRSPLEVTLQRASSRFQRLQQAIVGARR